MHYASLTCNSMWAQLKVKHNTNFLSPSKPQILLINLPFTQLSSDLILYDLGALAIDCWSCLNINLRPDSNWWWQMNKLPCNHMIHFPDTLLHILHFLDITKNRFGLIILSHSKYRAWLQLNLHTEYTF